MAKSSKATAKKSTQLPQEALDADAKIRDEAARVKANMKKRQEADALAEAGNTAEAEQLLEEANEGTKPRQRLKGKATKKAPPKRQPNKGKAAANATKRSTKRRTKGKRPDRHDGKDISYPKTVEEGRAHAEAVREKVRQCPPAKASGVKTTADVKNPKSEVKMRKKQSVTKVTKGRKRKTTAQKTTTRKAPAKKTTARKPTNRKTTARKSTSAGNGRLGDFTNTQKITISKSAKRDAGEAAKLRYAVLKSGMTVEKALDILRDKGFKGRRGWLRREREAGRLTIK